jgi:hypothetical protein
MGNVHRYGRRVCLNRALPHQIVGYSKRRGLEQFFAAALLVTLAVPNCSAQALDPKEFTDVTLKTGSQLKDRLDQLFKDRDVTAAGRYFEERKLLPQADGLAEITFRTVITKETYDLFFIPFAEPRPRLPDVTHLAVSAAGPKGSRVVLGTIAAEGKEPVVKDENVVVEGKVQPAQPGQAFLKNWLKCAALGCLQAGACFAGGPAGALCFCLGCGVGSLAGCAIFEYLFP